MKNIKLYAYPTSPYANKVSCFLSFKGIDFEYIPVNPINTKEIQFTKQKVVPVLKIDDEWRTDSTPIGLWLDACFPEKSILPEDASERALILSIDEWVTQEVIPYQFHKVVHWPSISQGVRQGWLLSKTVNASKPLPLWARFLWPIIIKKAPFIVAMINPLDANKTQTELQARLLKAFKKHWGGGPFLGGYAKVSLADLSLYGVLSVDKRLSIPGPINQFYQDPVVLKWASSVEKTLPKKILLVDHLQ